MPVAGDDFPATFPQLKRTSLTSSAPVATSGVNGVGHSLVREGHMPDEPLEPHDVLRIEACYTVDRATLILAGEFDMTGRDRFRAFVNEALMAGRSITIDASGLEFVDSAGLQALLQAREAAREAGVAFGVSDPSPTLRRLVELSGLEDLLWPE
jgi:anti-sigma B factor antagonist